ncbi:MAG: hypothetical protein KTR20_07430 [Cellvibrionaceae bacterium]|nr:hypothetical protein [Cellvibrionaceae bacterium]
MNTVGDSILTGALEALEFTQGKDNSCEAHIDDAIDVSAIRSRMKMTQQQFSSQFGLNLNSSVGRIPTTYWQHKIQPELTLVLTV